MAINKLKDLAFSNELFRQMRPAPLYVAPTYRLKPEYIEGKLKTKRKTAFPPWYSPHLGNTTPPDPRMADISDRIAREVISSGRVTGAELTGEMSTVDLAQDRERHSKDWKDAAKEVVEASEAIENARKAMMQFARATGGIKLAEFQVPRFPQPTNIDFKISVDTRQFKNQVRPLLRKLKVMNGTAYYGKTKGKQPRRVLVVKRRKVNVLPTGGGKTFINPGPVMIKNPFLNVEVPSA